ncbi:MAG: redox-sensing transcriptional repressor Rex [Erysipelotrichales bacterium]
MSKYVPYATRKRLPIYYKLLKSLECSKVENVTSVELAKLLKIDSTTIRRDFSEIGKLGKKGTGYPVESMLKIFEEEFELNKLEGVILIGLGHLGSAVAKYYEIQDSISYVSQIYDLDPELIGTKFMDIEIHDYRDIKTDIDHDSKIAILTVPGDKAQVILNELVDLGIRGFINFTGTKVFCKNPEVFINEIDITQEIQSLIYDMRTDY